MKTTLYLVMSFTLMVLAQPSGIAQDGDSLNFEALTYWVPMPNASPMSPSPRICAMFYDSARQEIIAYGGKSSLSGAVLNDTWAWNGERWSLRSTGLDVWACGSAFDEARGVGVAFGGVRNGIPNNVIVGQTWEWDGTNWTQVATSGPNPRHNCAMAYDPVGQRLILHGGASDFPFNSIWPDTWVWDGESWTRIDGAGGPRRAGHAMAYDAKRGVMVLFGGIDYRGSAPTDTWEFYDNQWHQVATAGPPGGREFTLLYYDPDREITVMTGGGEWGGATGQGWPTSKYYTDTWAWDGVQWRQLHPVQPPRADILAAVGAYDSARGRWVMFGGAQNIDTSLSTIDSIREFDVFDWPRVGLPEISEDGLSMSSSGGLPPFQVETCTWLLLEDWSDYGSPTGQREMTLPLNGSAQLFRIGMADPAIAGNSVHVEWLAQPPTTALPSGNLRVEGWVRRWFTDADDDRLDGYNTVTIDAILDPQGAILEAGGTVTIREQLDSYTFADFVTGTFDTNLVAEGEILWEGRWTLYPPENTAMVAVSPTGSMTFHLLHDTYGDPEQSPFDAWIQDPGS